MALTLVNAIEQVRYTLNETYRGFTELMPNQVDRDFSGASAWANVDIATTYNETGDLTIEADTAAQYCTLAVASAPTTAGRQYRVYFDVTAYAGSAWTLQDFTGVHDIGTVSATGTRTYIDFRAETPGGFRLAATDTDSSATLDNFSLIDITNGFWSDDEITVWLQEGCRVFSSKSLLVEDLLTVDPMILTTPYYDSGDESGLADCLEIYAIIYNNDTAYKGLIKIHPRQIGNVAKSAVTGPPKYFCLFDRKLYIFPLASSTEVSSGTMDVLYAKETDDITEIADEYQHLPVLYAVAKAKQKDEKYGQAGAMLQQFYQEISFERGDKHDRETDSIEDFKIKSTQRGNNARR